MTLFIALTILFWLGVAGAAHMIWVSIQPGNWLDSWQSRLRKWDINGQHVKYRIFGGCAQCTSHFIAQVSFPIYLAIFIIGGWWALPWWVSIFWYGLIYVPISTNLNLFFITKLHK